MAAAPKSCKITLTRTANRRYEKPQMEHSSKELAIAIARAAMAEKAQQVVVLHVGTLVYYTDYFVICHGTSDRQVCAIAEHVLERTRAEGRRASGVEGMKAGQWVLLDYGDVMVHIFLQRVREFYQLEHLWGDAAELVVTDQTAVSAG